MKARLQTSKLKTLLCCSFNVGSSVTVHSPLFLFRNCG